jgi:hypothetical protein
MHSPNQYYKCPTTKSPALAGIGTADGRIISAVEVLAYKKIG